MEAYIWNGNRYYVYEDKHLISVTSILGCLASPGLLNWQLGLVAEKSIELRDHIALIGKEALMGIPDAVREARADVGTEVHKAIEQYIAGNEDVETSWEVENYMKAFRGFVHDYNPGFLLSENAVINLTHTYAGRFDTIAGIAGKKYLLDYKTSRSYPKGQAGLQLTAYAHAELIEVGDNNFVEMPQVDGGIVVHLSRRGYKLFDAKISDESFEVFKKLRAACEIRAIMEEKLDEFLVKHEDR